MRANREAAQQTRILFYWAGHTRPSQTRDPGACGVVESYRDQRTQIDELSRSLSDQMESMDAEYKRMVTELNNDNDTLRSELQSVKRAKVCCACSLCPHLVSFSFG